MNGQNEGYFELNVLGNKLVFRHDSDPQTLREAEVLLKHRVDLVRRNTKPRDHLDLMMMTAFHLVVELMNERSERAMPSAVSIGDCQIIEELVSEMLLTLEPLLKSDIETGSSSESD